MNRGINKNGDMLILKGEDITITFTLTDDSNNAINLSTYTDIRLQIRETVSSATTILSASLVGDYISFVTDGSDGKFQLVVPNSVTTAIVPNKGVYDLELETGAGVVTRYLQGRVTIDPEVTR